MKRHIANLFVAFLLTTGCSQQNSGLDNEPSFASTSRESISLRYHFLKGKRYPFRGAIKMNATAKSGSRRLKLGNTLSYEGYYILRQKKGNNYLIDYHLTRIRQKLRFNDRHAEIDTSDRQSFRRTEFHAIVKSPISVEIDAYGRIGHIRHAMLSNNNQQLYTIFKEILRNSFVRLPVKRLKAGDTFEGEDVSYQEKSQPFLLKVKTRYRVSAISADRAHVLLITRGKIDLKPTNPLMSLEVDKQAFNGWILMNARTGHVERSANKLITRLELKSRRKADMDLVNYSEYRSQ